MFSYVSSFFSNLKLSWEENINFIFNMESLKFFFLTSLKSVKTALPQFLIAILIFFLTIEGSVYLYQLANYFALPNKIFFIYLHVIISLIAVYIYIVFMIALLRASKVIKNFDYFINMLSKSVSSLFAIIILYMLIISFFVIMVIFLFNKDYSYFIPNENAGLVIFRFILFPLINLYFLFTMDSRAKFDPLMIGKRSILMYLYNLPFFMIMNFVIFLGLILISSLINFKFITLLLEITVPLILTINFYTIRINDQLNLYYRYK